MQQSQLRGKKEGTSSLLSWKPGIRPGLPRAICCSSLISGLLSLRAAISPSLARNEGNCCPGLTACTYRVSVQSRDQVHPRMSCSLQLTCLPSCLVNPDGFTAKSPDSPADGSSILISNSDQRYQIPEASLQKLLGFRDCLKFE